MASGIEFSGVYNPSTLYKLNDIVTYGGATYIALQEGSNHSPSTSPTYWNSLVGGIEFIGAFSGAIAYVTGDIVSYGGNNYIAVQDTSGNIPTNTTYWKLFSQGFSFQNAFNNGTTYLPGQVVRYGSNAFIATTTTTVAPSDLTKWAQITSGQSPVGSAYSAFTSYKVGDLIQYGGYIYVCSTASQNHAPSDTNYWTQYSTGFVWSGTYSSVTTYQKGEVVNYNGSSFVSTSFANLNNQPDSNINSWSLMMQGSANNVYTTAGDIAYRNDSAIVRLPVGTSGQVLAINNSTGLPVWENNDLANNVYYVSQNGVDAVNYGRTLGRPFATLQYATKNVTTPCTIFVKAGEYFETLPIVVPSSCAIVGDSLRNTFISPKADIVTTSTYVSSNFAPITLPTFTGGTSSYNTLRSTVTTALPTIKDGVISYLSSTYPSLVYNQVKCRRDVDIIVRAVLADLVFGSNYQSTKAGIAYLRSYASVVISSQKSQTIAGINKARDLVVGYTTDPVAQSAIAANFLIVTNIINNGLSSVPSLTFPDPSGVAQTTQYAKANLTLNKAFMQAEIVAWIAANYTIANIQGYNASTASTDIGYMIDAITYDTVYGGNSQTLDIAASYYVGGTNLTAGSSVAIAAYGRLKTIIQQVVQSITVSKSVGNAATQDVSTTTAGTPIASAIATLMDSLVTIEQNGITVTVSNANNITVGMVISGTGFTQSQTVLSINSNTLSISSISELTPSGTLSFTQNFYSLDSIQVANNRSTMFLLSDSTLVKQLTFKGMTGFALSGTDTQDITTATIGGVFFRLNPASPIINKSPYITDCSAFSTGGVGVIVDGSVHNTGNKSMVFHAFTNINDLGVGFWMKDNAKAEIVSCFTYYCHFGYATTGGAKIRSLNGNNSYGTYGVVSRGYDATETPITGTVYGNQITYNSNSLNGNGFSVSDTITGLTSGARATVTNVQAGSYKVYFKRISGTFTSGETITGSVTGTSAVIATGGVTGQKGFVIVATGITSQPIIGTSIEFDGDTSAYVIQQVGTWINSSSIVQIVMAQEKVVASLDGTATRIRANFSQSRLTGHDFLSIGTGGTVTTNYPGYPTQSASPGNQTIEVFPGRVFYISTDQDGNFKVGNYFAVNQATGTATLNANAFNLSGLSALRLGSVGAQLGELISEFTSDVTLGSDSNSKVPTQHAVKYYVDNKVNNTTQLSIGTSPTQTQVKLTGTGASTDTVDINVNGVLTSQVGASYILIPAGPKDSRPSAPAVGYMRYNTTINSPEIWNGSQWTGVGGGNPWTIKTADAISSAGDRFMVDTTAGAVTITLPSGPSIGDTVRIMDVAGKFNTNNCTVARNGAVIMGDAANMTVNTKNASFSLIYSNTTYGWRLGEA
jgi:hypothetical protein